MYDRRILLPANRTLVELARAAHAAAEEQLLIGVRREVANEVLVRWEREIFTARAGGSILEWLQQPPAARVKDLRQQVERIDYLKALGVHRHQLASIRSLPAKESEATAGSPRER